MSEDNEDLQDIPTLTDVVKSGNPSLVFNLSPPPSTEEDEGPESALNSAEHAMPTEPTEPTEQLESEQAAKEDEPEESKLTPPLTVTSPSGSYEIDLKDLGLPETFFHDQPEPPYRETAGMTTISEGPPATEALAEADFNPESLLMALEAPVSGVLQKHMEMAREEILGLIRDEVARQLRAHGVSRD